MHNYRKALILGYGRSGQAAQQLLESEGCKVQVFSQDQAAGSKLLNALADKTYDICIVSPGFALTHPWVVAVKRAGIPLLSELELGWSRHRGRTIAVTGSNGKSTAVKWIHETLELAGFRSAIGGNYGIPASEVVMNHSNLDWLVLEVSSFQLETVEDFNAEFAILLNVLPNHLNRHGNMEEYRRVKLRIFGPPGTKGVAIIPASLTEVLENDMGGDRNWTTFGPEPRADFRYESGRVFKGSQEMLDVRGTLFDSRIIGGCTAAAVAAFMDRAGIAAEQARMAAGGFSPLPHRLRKIGELDGVVYVNDSKATNLAAMAAALESIGGNVHLIAGGLSKESDYTFVKEMLAERVRSLYVIGQASRAMCEAWNGVCRCVECGTLENAFDAARKAARPGDTVLLSPGCASFDQFAGFEERGERFEMLFHGAGNA